MAWYPGATKLELQPESDQQAAIRPTQLIVHSLAAPWTARRTYEYWRDSTNLESHFGLGYAGDLAQYIGTETRADANAGANLRPDGTGAVSIETASNTGASDPWTEAQIEQLVRLGVWLHHQHGIPLRICSTPSDPGFGYHRLHREWSTSGTACPGDARVRQFHDAVFPAIVARATQTTTPTTPEEDPVPQRALYSTSDTHIQTLQPGTWTTLTFDRVYEDGDWQDKAPAQTVLHVPSHYTGGFAIRVQGLADGQEIQMRLGHNYYDAGGWHEGARMPITSPVHRSGAGHFTYNWSAQIGGARDDRLVCQVLVPGDGEPVTVDWARAELLYWPAS